MSQHASTAFALALFFIGGCAAAPVRIAEASKALEPAGAVATASPAAEPCAARDLGAIGSAAMLRLERCPDAPSTRLVSVKSDGTRASALLDEDLGSASAGWEAFPTRFQGVATRGGSISTLVFHRRAPDARRTKDAWVLVAALEDAAGLHVVARIGPVQGDAILTHAIEDLDGDGVPELRVGIAERFHGERKVKTYALGPQGYAEAALPSAHSPSLCDGSDQAIHKADPDAPAHVPCDPVLDFERARVTAPDGKKLLLASGPYAACSGRGCPVIVMSEERPAVLVRSFGFLAVETSGSELAIAVRKAPGEDEGSRRYCYRGDRMKPCEGEITAAKAPWAALAPPKIDEPD